MAHERMRNEDARGGDVIVQDSVASGRPAVPIAKDPTGRETPIAITTDGMGEGAAPVEGSDRADEQHGPDGSQ